MNSKSTKINIESHAGEPGSTFRNFRGRQINFQSPVILSQAVYGKPPTILSSQP